MDDPIETHDENHDSREAVVHWLNFGGDEPYFYGEPRLSPKPGRLARRVGGLYQRLVNAENHAGRAAKAIEGWLKRRIRPDEPMLASLRWARELRLRHGPEHAEPEVLRTWRRYLRHRFRRHLALFLLYFAFTPLTLPLAILPGPNVIGFYFAYRAYAHAIATLGTWRGLRMPVECETDSRLDGAVDPHETSRVDRLGRDLGLDSLAEFAQSVARSGA